MSDEYPRYKRTLSKPPINGWHCVVDGYDFKYPTREILIARIAQYLRENKKEGDAARLVEIAFCEENPGQCVWEG